MSSPSTVSGWRRAKDAAPARSTTAQRRSLIAVARAPSVTRGTGRVAAGAAAGDAATVAATGAGGCSVASLRAARLVRRQSMHRLPRRDAQRQIEQFDRAAHVDGVLRQPPDVALHQHQILGRVVRGGRIVAAVAEPDLMHHHARLRRHGAVHAAEQHEAAHGFAIGARHRISRAASPDPRRRDRRRGRPWCRDRGGGCRGRARWRRAPSRRRNRAPPWRRRDRGRARTIRNRAASRR